jgi:hypothetical protein
MDITREFTREQFAEGLESWKFLKLKGMTPLFTSAFGDVFFRARNGVWFLDTIEGTLVLVCKQETELQQILTSEIGLDRYLMWGLAQAAANAGIVPEGDQVLDFTVAPVIGGPMEVSNIGALDFVVKLNIAGQIHGQVRKMKPGTKVSGFTIS